MKNSEVRAWYRQKVAKIWILDRKRTARGMTLEARARRAWRIRHQARLRARAMMEDKLEVEALRARDRQLYGDPNGPTFDQLVKLGQQTGLSEDSVYERIIKGAQTTNLTVDKAVLSEDPRNFSGDV